MKTTLRPPKTLLARVRWIFLLVAITGPALTVPPLFAATTAWPLKAVTLAGLLLLTWYWVRGYRRGHFSHAGKAFEGLVVLGVGLAIGTPLHLLMLVYNGLVFRSLYGERRDAAGTALTYVGGFLGAAALSWLLTGSSIPLLELLPHVIGMTLLTGVFHLLATVLRRNERAVFRERALREAGAALVAALDRKSVYEEALDAALNLVGETPEVQVGLAVGSEERMIVVTSAGNRAQEIEGVQINLHALPEPFRARMLEKQPLEIRHDDAADFRRSLDISPRAQPFFMTPLFIEEELRGVIAVASASPLSEESKDGLVALGSQVSLALESISLMEKLHRRRSEERFRSLIQNSSDIIMVLGADGTIDYISPSVQKVLGYAPEDLIGKYNFTLLHPDDVARVQHFHTENISAPGTSPALEARLRHRDGSWRYVEGVGNNLLDEPDIKGSWST